MDLAELDQYKLEVERRWNELQDECKHLQGEHRLILKLLEGNNKEHKENQDATN